MQHGFGRAVERHRKRLDLTFRGFSKAIEEETGVSIDSGGLSRIESGQREPRLTEALAIARVLGVPLEQLTGASGSHMWVLVDRLKIDLARVLSEIEDLGETVVGLEDLFSRVPEDEQQVIQAWTRMDQLHEFVVMLQDAEPAGRELLDFLRFPSRYIPGLK